MGRPLDHRHHRLTTPARRPRGNNPLWKNRTDRLHRDAPEPNDDESPIDKVETNPTNHRRWIRVEVLGSSPTAPRSPRRR